MSNSTGSQLITCAVFQLKYICRIFEKKVSILFSKRPENVTLPDKTRASNLGGTRPYGYVTGFLLDVIDSHHKRPAHRKHL